MHNMVEKFDIKRKYNNLKNKKVNIKFTSKNKLNEMKGECQNCIFIGQRLDIKG